MSLLSRRSLNIKQIIPTIPPDMIAGWGPVMAQVLPDQAMSIGDFEVDSNGALSTATPGGAAYGGQFSTYVDGAVANDGRYDISETMSVTAPTTNRLGFFDIFCHMVPYQGAPKPTAAVMRPILKNGSVRSTVGGRFWFKLGSRDGDRYGLSFQLIRDDQVAGAAWPDWGEVNAMEGSLTSTTLGGNYHPAVGSPANGDTRSPQQRDELLELRFPGVAMSDDTETVLEWRPPQPGIDDLGSLRYFRNGKLFHQTRDRVPSNLMMWNLQAGPHYASGPYVDGHIRLYGAKAWEFDPNASIPAWETHIFPFDLDTAATPLKTGAMQNFTGPVVSALAFSVTQSCKGVGVMWHHPGDDPKVVDVSLWDATRKITEKANITVGKGRNPIYFDTTVNLSPGVEYQVQVAGLSGTVDITSSSTALSTAKTDGYITTAGIASPCRYGDDPSVRASTVGSNWRGIGPIIKDS